MKIAIIGYGKMGHVIERIAKERGHEIVCTIDMGEEAKFDSTEFKTADVAIEFTQPTSAIDNYLRCSERGVTVVSGTTGWTSKMDEVKSKMKVPFFWTSNFSLGVNIVMDINKKLAAIMKQYDGYKVDMTEIHHTEKKDAPSGTAIVLADQIEANYGKRPEIESIREGKVPGIHEIRYDSEFDIITLRHEAKSRDGLALGAVVAAEFMKDKPTGYYSMNDLMNSSY